MADPKSVAQLRKAFTEQSIKSSMDTADNIYKAGKNQEQRKQHKIIKSIEAGKAWSGDVFDIEGIGHAFNREAIGKDFKDAIKDAEAPGTVGDLMISQLQGDHVATMERAFRVRHQSRVRGDIHSIGRRYGMAHDAGIFKRGLEGYLAAILRKSKDNQ